MEKALLATEQSNPRTANIDKMTTMEMLHAMNEENRRVADAVEDALSQIAPLVDHIAEEMEKGGRIFYIGAGTSGRLGVIDAAECPPTFGVSPDKVVAVMAGGTGAMANASEGCEDDAEAGEHDLMKYSINEHDTVIGHICCRCGSVCNRRHGGGKACWRFYCEHMLQPGYSDV